jgi:ribosomal protein S18 acetylase RimI-like enzyme
MIVDATETDWPRIEQLAADAGSFGEQEMEALGAVWEEYILLGAEDSGYEFLVDQEGDSARGFICYGPRDLADGVHDLYYLAVDPAARRQGVGRRLLNAAEAEAREAGARMMIAESSSTRHAPGRSLCQASGYEIEAAIKDFYSVGDDLLILVKRF